MILSRLVATSNLTFRFLADSLSRAREAGERLGALLRIRDWLGNKIPQLLIPFYLLVLHRELPFTTWPLVLGLLAYFLTTAALGYFLNDLGDIDSDARAGKLNRVSRLTRVQRRSWLAALLGMSFGSLLLLPMSPLLVGLALAEFACFIAYSFSPLRLKERRLGIITDALYAHMLPFAIAGVAVSAGRDSASGLHPFVAPLALFWQFVQGIRNILGHQLADLDADLRAGVWTFTAQLGAARARLLQQFALPAIEMSTFLGLLTVAPFGSLCLATYLVYVVACGLKWSHTLARGYRPWKDPYLADRLATDFYNSWLPPLLLVLLTGLSGWFALVLLGHLLLFRLPRIGSVPSPPSWQVDVWIGDKIHQAGPVMVSGWCLASDLAPEWVEVSVDGRPVARAPFDRYLPELAQRFAQPQKAFRGFEVIVPPDQAPRAQSFEDLHVTAILADGWRFTLHRGPATISTRPSA